MCTSIIYSPKDHYFGRNLDLEISFGQQVVITPRNYQFNFRNSSSMDSHHALIGVAMVADGYPLYFDAINEAGLGMAGLNFDGPCHYFPLQEGKDNVASFEFIPYMLGKYETVAQAKEALKNINLTNENFSEKMQASPLHWLMADKTGASITIEQTKAGMNVYDNPVGALTNNPEFPTQFLNLSNYQAISPANPVNSFAPDTDLVTYSRGMGTHTLPGGMDSSDRFVKVVFTKEHAPKGNTEEENVTNYFHILHAVEQQKNLDEVAPNSFEYTIYTDCMNLDTGMFYYTNYTNNQINAVDLNKTDLTSDELATFDIIKKQAINYEN